MPSLGQPSTKYSSRSSRKRDLPLAGSVSDYLIHTKPGIKRPLAIPMYEAVPVFIIKNLLRTAGMTRERYFELLQNG